MNDCHPEIFGDHVRDLSSAKESVVFLSLLLLQVDLFEVRNLSSDLRIERSEVRINSSKHDVLRSSTEVALSTSLIQRNASDWVIGTRTHFCLEARFPTLECRRRRECSSVARP